MSPLTAPSIRRSSRARCLSATIAARMAGAVSARLSASSNVMGGCAPAADTSAGGLVTNAAVTQSWLQCGVRAARMDRKMAGAAADFLRAVCESSHVGAEGDYFSADRMLMTFL